MTFIGHDGSSYLTKSHAMPPPRSVQYEALGHTVKNVLGLDRECSRLQMRTAQRATDFQFLW